mgnify:CR=1 FL=1
MTAAVPGVNCGRGNLAGTQPTLCSDPCTTGVLADKTELQHLRLGVRNLPGGAASAAQLLSELQHLQQLTFLDLQNSMRAAIGNPPASAFSALTASSRLQYLSISTCTLPAGIWQHMFPAGRQLPDLLELDIAGIWMPSCSFATAPHGSNLVRCVSFILSSVGVPLFLIPCTVMPLLVCCLISVISVHGWHEVFELTWNGYRC